MNLQSVRMPARDPREPLSHELQPLQLPGRMVGVTLALRLADDGAWRGRLRFSGAGDDPDERETAEIFCGETEDDLWQSVQRLREHHFRDLFRSLA